MVDKYMKDIIEIGKKKRICGNHIESKKVYTRIKI